MNITFLVFGWFSLGSLTDSISGCTAPAKLEWNIFYNA